MFINKITGVNFIMSLCKYNYVTVAINDAAPYIPCLESHKNLISTAIPLKISKIKLKIMHIQKTENKHFDQNNPKDPFCVTRIMGPATRRVPYTNHSVCTSENFNTVYHKVPDDVPSPLGDFLSLCEFGRGCPLTTK